MVLNKFVNIPASVTEKMSLDDFSFVKIDESKIEKRINLEKLLLFSK